MRTLRRFVCTAAVVCAVVSALAEDSHRVNLWPVYYYDPPDEMVCLPFFARDRDSFFSLPVCWGKDFATVPPTLSWYSHSSDGLENYIGLCGFFDVSFKGGNYAKSWLAPLFYHDRKTFVSPLIAYCDDFGMIPAALSWRSQKGGNDAYRMLLGLCGTTQANGKYDCSWLFPLYYHDRDEFMSLAACWGDDYGVVPAALSWYRKTGDDEDYRFLLGLGGVSFSDGAFDRSWMLPLYYSDTHQFLSPLVGWGDNLQAIPAALSWRSTRGQRDSYRALLGLGGLTFESGHYGDSWLFPLYYHDDHLFMSPLVGWGDHLQAIPAALSWHETAGTRESYRTLLGLGSVTLKKNQYEQSWLLPLYYHDKSIFLSLLSFWGRDWGVCPAALSWYWKDGKDESYFALLGLGGLMRDSGTYDRSWLFPLYYHDSHRFVSPLVGWGDSFGVLPPLLSWHNRTEDQESYVTLLGLGGLTYRNGHYGSSWLAPLYYHDADGSFVTLPYGRTSNGWHIPALLTSHTTDENGQDELFIAPLLSSVTMREGGVRRLQGFLGLLLDADYTEKDKDSWSILLMLANHRRKVNREYWNALILGGYSEENGKYSGSHLFPIFWHDDSGAFVSLLPYSTWTTKEDRQANFNGCRNDLYGYCLLKSTGKNYSRWSFLWKFYDCVEKDGDVSVDAFPGITYDEMSDGTVDFTLWHRFFRYRSTPSGVTDLSIFFIPFK